MLLCLSAWDDTERGPVEDEERGSGAPISPALSGEVCVVMGALFRREDEALELSLENMLLRTLELGG